MKNSRINQKDILELENNNIITALNEDELQNTEGGMISTILGVYSGLFVLAIGVGYVVGKIEEKKVAETTIAKCTTSLIIK